MIKENENLQFKYFFYLLGAVFFIHSAFLFTKINIEKTPYLPLTESSEESVIKLSFAPKELDIKTKNQIVETSKTDLEVSAVDEVFLGETDNRVDRQTRAEFIGSYKDAGIGSKQGNADISQKEKKAKKSETISLSDLSVGHNPAQALEEAKEMQMMKVAKGLQNGSASSTGFSQTSDFLETLPLGDFTKLNTQEFEFYGFYHRIKLKLEQFWGRNIQEQAEKFYRSGRRMPASDNHLTSLVVTLNEKGEIINVNLKSTSGITELDSAAIDAFNQAGPFPNPPEGMMVGGKATIEWGFVVNT